MTNFEVTRPPTATSVIVGPLGSDEDIYSDVGQ